jgi:hypothetical protein
MFLGRLSVDLLICAVMMRMMRVAQQTRFRENLSSLPQF